MRYEDRGRTVDIPVDGARLAGDMVIPPRARGLIVFAHGSGSDRRSARNTFVADTLQNRDYATLLFDLLTEDERRLDDSDSRLRFDVALLAERLVRVTDWIRADEPTGQLPLAYFGASTGAAAAFVAAAERPDVSAVVSRGGRPDLAGAALARVTAPTLLIVGGADTTVLGLNREALEKIPATRELAIVPGASHLFAERGALEEVAYLAGEWFARYLVPVQNGA